jgi:hypothetical protein
MAVLGLTICLGAAAQELTLEFISGSAWTDQGGRSVQQETGDRIPPDALLTLGPSTHLELGAGESTIVLSNPGNQPLNVSMATVLSNLGRVPKGRDLISNKIAKILGKEQGERSVAVAGVRGEDQEQLGTAPSEMSDYLEGQIQAAVQAGDGVRAVSLITEAMDYAEDGQFGDLCVLLSKEYLDQKRWQDLDAWTENALATYRPLDAGVKQQLFFIRSLGAIAQGLDPQPDWDRLIGLDPGSDLAESLVTRQPSSNRLLPQP